MTFHRYFNYDCSMEEQHRNIPGIAAAQRSVTHPSCAPDALERIASQIPPDARACIAALEAGGYSAWLVGGDVRDLCMGRRPSDADIATSAPVHTAADLLAKAGWKIIPTGVKHGTITALSPDGRLEVTTFRTEGDYADNRHPSSVRFVDSIDEDLARRDFTINAMALHPLHGLKDPFGGIEDARRGVVKAVGDPCQRFSEDGLRILRCLRFASQLSFSIDGDTLDAAAACAPSIANLSAERIEAEASKLLCGPDAARVILECHEILEFAIPGIEAMAGLDQRSPYHCFDVLEHTARVLGAVPPDPELRYAALFHDMGKPSCMTVDERGRGHFPDHPRRSEEMARSTMANLRCPRRTLEHVALLVREHDEELHATESSIRRMAARLGGDEELLRKLICLRRADALAHAPEHTGGAEEMAKTLEVLDSMDRASRVFKLSDLAITGADLKAAGMEEGPAIGAALSALFEDAVEGRIENDREALLRKIRGTKTVENIHAD